VKIRHFGWLANRRRKGNLAQCRQLLDVAAVAVPAVDEREPDHTCPVCHIGVLRIVDWLTVASLPEATLAQPIPLDSS
jgi:hypothetical protein